MRTALVIKDGHLHRWSRRETRRARSRRPYPLQLMHEESIRRRPIGDVRSRAGSSTPCLATPADRPRCTITGWQRAATQQ